MRKTRSFTAIGPDGTRYSATNVASFCDEHGLTAPAVYKLLSGKGRSHKGWKFANATDQEAAEAVSTQGKADQQEAGESGFATIATLDLSQYGCPPLHVGPEVNPEHFRWKYRINSNVPMAAALGIQEQPKGYNVGQVQSLLDAECRAHGFDPKHLADTRTDAEKALDAITQFKEAPESLMELAEDEIDAIEKSMLDALRETTGYMDDRLRKVGHDPGLKALRPKDPGAKLERWLALIRKVKTLRLWAISPCPPKRSRPKVDPYGPITDENIDLAWRASHLLRFTCYVGRSSMTMDRSGKPSEHVYRWVRCHAKAVADLWVAENGVIVTVKDGFLTDEVLYKGAMIVMPPGHGKTTIGDHWTLRRIAEDPRQMGALLHAKEDKAKDSLKYVASCMNGGNASGRRFKSLYPKLEQADTDNNSSTIRLKTRDAAKSPTLQAFGCKSAGLGHDTTFQKWDDVVPQSDIEQPTERDRRHKLLTNTFGSRQRGQHAFTLIMGYFWHHDDALSRIYQDAKLAEKNQGGVRMVVSIQKCGGPKSSRPFFPLWREAYPAAELRARYRQMRDPRAYAANYMGDPRAAESRIVTRLALFDTTSPEHAEFMRSSHVHVSLDPAGTNRATSDKAGIIRCGVGEVKRKKADPEGGADYDEYVQRIRVVGAKQINANQHELVNYVLAQSLQVRIDYIHVEVTSGFFATADGFREMGVENVVEHTPGNKNKEVRLRNISTMLENSHASTGIEAVVEFPGVPIIRDDGAYVMETNDRGEQIGRKLKPDPEFDELFNQVLDFGVAVNDHLVDPLVHVCKYLSRDIGIMDGAISRIVRKELDNPRNRLQDYLDQFKSKYPANGQTAWQEDAEFCPMLT